MRYETQTVRVGEYLGPVDWNYDFAKHFERYCGTDALKAELCARSVAWLRLLEAKPDAWRATTDTGSPRCGVRPVLCVGMYDGWPYWRPVPSVQLDGVFGAEWHSFDCITDIY